MSASVQCQIDQCLHQCTIVCLRVNESHDLSFSNHDILLCQSPNIFAFLSFLFKLNHLSLDPFFLLPFVYFLFLTILLTFLTRIHFFSLPPSLTSLLFLSPFSFPPNNPAFINLPYSSYFILCIL